MSETENRWAAFTNDELKELFDALHHEGADHHSQLAYEIELELGRRRSEPQWASDA